MGGGDFLSLFYFFGGDGTHLPHPRRSLYTPPVETPAPSAPGTAAHDRQQLRPRQIQGRPCKARHTRPDVNTLHRSAPYTRQAAPGRSYRRQGGGGRAMCPAKCTISDAIFILIYICIFCAKLLTTQI
nr:MAG TPA: hypothetical protein [Caudoviricetes sp.]